jgi:hypothetical protein
VNTAYMVPNINAFKIELVMASLLETYPVTVPP